MSRYDRSMAFEPPRPDAAKLLSAWLEWEQGETTPGRTLANLKTGGMKELLESLVLGADSPA